MKWIGKEELANILIGYRTEHNMSRAELARLLGVKRSLIQNWEEERCLPSVSNSRKLAEVLGADPIFLIQRIER